MSPTGRPLALDAEKSAELCSLVASGVTVEQAARHVGCCLQTVRRHARRDPEFKRQLKSARTAAPVEPLRLVRRAAGSHWRAAAWLLERTEPERYAARPAASCRPEQVEDLVARLLEAALDALSCDEKQRFRVFKRVDQTAQEGLSRLFPAGRKPRASSVFTPHTDHMRLCDEYQLLREDEEDEEDEEHDEQGNDPPAPAQPKTQPLSASADQAAEEDDFSTAQNTAAGNKTVNPFVSVMLRELARRLNEKLPPKLQNPSLLSPKIDAPKGEPNPKSPSLEGRC